MERGALAPLSPNEEITLRRIAIGIARASKLRSRDVTRLIRLLWSSHEMDGSCSPIKGAHATIPCPRRLT
jgi:hypothetical protein